MKKLILVLGLLLGACNSPPEPLAWYEQPNDPQVENRVFNQCLDRAKGPSSVHYNDLDEAIAECRAEADSQSRYCVPAGERPCPPSSSTRADVRAILGEK